MSDGRLWGFWTQGKLAMLRDYLHEFTTASKRAPRTTYLDLFAGQASNADKDSGEVFEGSPEIALATSPPFTDLRFFEWDDPTALESSLRARFPSRDFRVVPGDTNLTIAGELADGTLDPLAPAFAFIDQEGPDCHWTTLEALAGFKQGRFKVEVWMLFPVGFFKRLLPVSGSARPADADRMTLMYGTDEWLRIYDARRGGKLDSDGDRFEYTNLMRWRLQQNLGYVQTHAVDVTNSKGVVMYALLFATDNAAGHRIMSHLYAKAVNDFPVMAEEARRRQRAQLSLQLDISDVTYVHEPPLPPLGSAARSSP